MSEDKWLFWIERQPCLAKLTPDALAEALDGFPLEPPQGMAWLARAIQGVLLHTLPRELIGCEEVTAGKVLDPTRAEIKRAARAMRRLTQSFWGGLYKHGFASGPDFPELERNLERLVSQIAELEEMPADPPRWRQREARDARTARAENLAVVFELAFGTDATVNNWPDTPCKRRDLYRSGRCKLHGGLSTGPRNLVRAKLILGQGHDC